MYTLQAQPKLSILQQEFFIFGKNHQKLKSIQKFRENDLESAKIPYGYEKTSIFYELFAQKKIKLIA